MAVSKKCAHKLCKCKVSEGGPWGKYCSAHCEEAADTDALEIYCDCKHPECTPA
jgi:hypothetical protein